MTGRHGKVRVRRPDGAESRPAAGVAGTPEPWRGEPGLKVRAPAAARGKATHVRLDRPEGHG